MLKTYIHIIFMDKNENIESEQVLPDDYDYYDLSFKLIIIGDSGFIN